MSRALSTRLVCVALAASIGSLPAAAAVPGPPNEEAWVGRLSAAHRAVDQALTRHAEALASYRQARHRKRLRGEKKGEILEKIEAAQEALRKAERELVALQEEARRAGVPPGWMRRAEAQAPAAAAR